MTTANPSIAIVTGASGILGPAICRALRTAGWKVIASDLNDDLIQLRQKLGEPVDVEEHFIFADLSQEHGCQQLIQNALETGDDIGLIVNNAALSAPSTIAAFSTEQADKMWRVNCVAPILLARFAQDALARCRGQIINISSLQSSVSLDSSLIYPATKAALERITEQMSLSLGPMGVRANCVRVGSVPGFQFLREAVRNLSTEDARAMYRELMPIHQQRRGHRSIDGRSCTPEDIAKLIAFVASNDSRSLQGACLTADCGFTHVAHSSDPYDPGAAVSEWLEKRGL